MGGSKGPQELRSARQQDAWQGGDHFVHLVCLTPDISNRICFHNKITVLMHEWSPSIHNQEIANSEDGSIQKLY